jgi:hypothetical protein
MLILKIVALCPIHGYAISRSVSSKSPRISPRSRKVALSRASPLGKTAAGSAGDWRESETGREAKILYAHSGNMQAAWTAWVSGC